MKSTASSTTAKLVAPAQAQVCALTSEVEAQGRNAALASTSAVAAMLVPLSSASATRVLLLSPGRNTSALSGSPATPAPSSSPACDAT